MSDMKDFKKQLKALKEKGADIDPDEIIQELTTPAPAPVVEEFAESFDNKAFQLLRNKVNKLLDDFEGFYGPKGRGLSIAIHIQKENSADRYSENSQYTDNLGVVHIVDIGTPGKYQPVDIVGEDGV